MDRVPVLVTGVGGASIGEQLIKALRLAETPYHIVGADVTRSSKGLADADEAVVLPLAANSEYLERLLDVCARFSIRAVLCGSEAELPALDSGREAIAEQGILLPLQPGSVLDLCSNKTTTRTALRELGFGVPDQRRITTVSDAVAVPFLPAVLKPTTGTGSTNVFLAQTPEELLFFARHLMSITPDVVAEEYVGTPDAEFTVGVLSDLDGKFLNSIAVRRDILSGLSNRIRVENRTGRQDLGTTLAISSGVSQGEIGRFRDVCHQAEAVAGAVGSRGPLNIQCRMVNGNIVVFDINPRFSGTTSLRAMVGFNEPDLLIRRHLFGEDVPTRFTYGHGMIRRGLQEVLLSDVLVENDEAPSR